MNCPECQSPGAYVGLIEVECHNNECRHFCATADAPKKEEAVPTKRKSQPSTEPYWTYPNYYYTSTSTWTSGSITVTYPTTFNGTSWTWTYAG